jgi:hypothetical protein
MTNHVARLYALVGGVFVFFVLWAAVAAHPWSSSTTAQDPRVAALTARERQIALESRRVKLIVDRRWAAYRKALSARNASNAAASSQAVSAQPVSLSAPSVKVVSLPPLVVTRTS